MTHPGGTWPRMTPHVGEEPVLVLDGRRSIYAAWPPTAVCASCATHEDAGYVGPTPADTDSVTYPDNRIEFVCRACARRSLDLGERELSGHRCSRRCRGDVHEDAGYLDRGELDGKTAEQRVARFVPGYAERGWRVLEVLPAPYLPATTGEAWAFRFVPARALW